MTLEEIQKYFESLNILDWEISGNINGGGQSSTIEVKNSKNGKRGVFRFLKRTTETDVKRFKREVKILTAEQFKNKNIVNILEYTKNDNSFWYISEKGEQFPPYWDSILNEYKDKPNVIIEKAIALIQKLLTGLIPLHKEKVVHRDIKPNNIVIVNDEPVLIDFGLAFDQADERITPIDSAVGNAKYSPDQMMNRLEEVPQWLDIFQITQLLIWMVSVKPTKNWTRPLDWRWVIYDSDASEDYVLSLKALTAICSDSNMAPKDASELNDLIKNIFFGVKMAETETRLNEILQKITKGRSISLIVNTNDMATFNASFNILLAIYKKIESALKQKCSELKRKLPVTDSYQDLDNWIKEVQSKEAFVNHEVFHLFSIVCGVSNRRFSIDSSLIFYVPSLNKIKGTDYLPDSFYPFAIEINTTGNDLYLKHKATSMYVSINRDGRLFISRYAGDFKTAMVEFKIDELIKKIVDLVDDPESWELINS